MSINPNLIHALLFGIMVGGCIWFFGWHLLYGLVLLLMFVIYGIATPLYWFTELLHRTVIALRHVLIPIEQRMK